MLCIIFPWLLNFITKCAPFGPVHIFCPPPNTPVLKQGSAAPSPGTTPCLQHVRSQTTQQEVSTGWLGKPHLPLHTAHITPRTIPLPIHGKFSSRKLVPGAKKVGTTGLWQPPNCSLLVWFSIAQYPQGPSMFLQMTRFQVLWLEIFETTFYLLSIIALLLWGGFLVMNKTKQSLSFLLFKW